MAHDRQQDEETPAEASAAAEEQTNSALDAIDRKLQEFVAEKGPALGRGEALTKLATANQQAGKLDVRLAEDRYGVGEVLIHFAAYKGHVALGYSQLGPCLKERFDLGRTWAYESMRFAKAATRDEIKDMPWTVASLGLDLLTLLEVKTFGALAKKALPVPGADGKPAHFPASPEVLEAAIAILEKARKSTPPTDEAEARLIERAALRKAEAILERHLAERPELAEAKPKVFLHDGRARVHIASVELRADTFAAVARLFSELEKALRRS